jgi:predicted nuclease of predicted toxin-antitoxin system
MLTLRENLIILTFDRDYGELIFRYGKQKQPGVVYFRDKGADPLFAGQILSDLLAAGQIKFENAFTVIESNNIRQRFY